MTSPRFRVGYVSILFLVLGFLYGTGLTKAQPDKEIDRLAKAYRAAKTEFERRAVCLDAIDTGVIADRRSVAVVDAIFGTTYTKKLPRRRELEWGFVDFHPLPPPPPGIQAGGIGWYLAFKYNSAGQLEDYFLTNRQK